MTVTATDPSSGKAVVSSRELAMPVTWVCQSDASIDSDASITNATSRSTSPSTMSPPQTTPAGST